ncbi:MAG: general secretion pathway protein GspK [Elusimicrobia bacterium]|nr:general secretion pathway protein GspK [Elusimicrobiota bacterium]
MNNRGVSLIIVLWVLVILAGICSSGIYISRLEIKKAKYQIDELKAFGFAKAGIESAIVCLYNDKNTYDAVNERWKEKPDMYTDFKLGGVMYSVVVEDEESKLNINTASKGMIEILLNAVGVNNKHEIVDSILDWKDSDSNPNPYGKENDYYQSLIPPRSCKNKPFDTIEELLLVKGFEDKNVLKEIENFITTYSIGRININTAQYEVLKTIPGIEESVVQKIIQYRRDMPFKSIDQLKSVIGDNVYSKINGFITLKSYNFRIKSRGRTGEISKTVEVIIEKEYDSMNLRYWREM